MKKIQSTALVLVMVFVLGSCSKTETSPPSAAETNAILLAGAKGASKNWKITQILGSLNGSAAQDIQSLTGTTFPACELDNVFQFSNNPVQTYLQTEGATSCTFGDPSTIETGSWAFTDNGKTLLIDAVVNATSTQLQSSAEPFLGYMILEYGGPITVVSLTAAAMTITYTYVDTSVTPADTYVITLNFASM